MAKQQIRKCKAEAIVQLVLPAYAPFRTSEGVQEIYFLITTTNMLIGLPAELCLQSMTLWRYINASETCCTIEPIKCYSPSSGYLEVWSVGPSNSRQRLVPHASVHHVRRVCHPLPSPLRNNVHHLRPSRVLPTPLCRRCCSAVLGRLQPADLPSSRRHHNSKSSC